ncbi:RloB family protein [Streptomyces sp. WMMC500]|uniref:RloB family protein n=1 Tax=Streptomyces sp. WMMC500 TaxID=3015154 RepID=UPI00248CA3DF|nr:RloB family protein [Streptomyces sp. WMMC500]WBB62892.1 RloB family protein [Streptomyces sp. WMMC500]
MVFVACEGESTEPDYLDYLNKEFGEGDTTRVPFRIHPIAESNGMLPTETVAAIQGRREDPDEGWVLFDRDGTDRDNDIQQAMKEAAAAGIEVAFSHPSFDLWLLLHFQAFSGTQSGSSKVVVEKLRSAKGAEAFRNYDKRNDKSVKGDRRAALEGKEKTAAANAKALVNSCEYGTCQFKHARSRPRDRAHAAQSTAQWTARSGHAPGCPVLKRDPSTDVWRLLACLGIVPHAN